MLALPLSAGACWKAARARDFSTGATNAAILFSSLAQITMDNVAGLKLVFSFRTGSPHGHSGATPVLGDTLFLLTPFPHALYALDLAKSGSVKWRYAPKPDRMAEGIACCDMINHGPVVAGDRVYLNTLDGHTLALEANTGTVIWDVQTASIASGETLTAAPLLADGKVVVGNSGDDFGARGWVAALDTETGRELWRRYSTGPDGDVGIGSGFKPFYAEDRGTDLGLTTWPPSGWEHGGGSVSGPLAYDPDLKLLFHGTGHPAPWNPDQRPGKNKWTSGVFARDLTTGEARWFDQLNPHDLYALGAGTNYLPVDREWQGKARKLLIHPDGNGYVYVFDRASGEILSAEPFGVVNETRGVDLATGALKREDGKIAHVDHMVRDACPASVGALGGAAALSPATGLLYIPANRLCMDFEARNTSFMRGAAFIGADVRIKAAPQTERGALIAWDVALAKPAWTVPEGFPLGSDVLTTAGGLVLYGTLDGYVKILNAKSGELLWQFKASSGIVGRPSAFSGPDGQEYLAVTAGIGGPLGMTARLGIDLRDATAARGLANALRDLPKPADQSGTLYVFKLP